MHERKLPERFEVWKHFKGGFYKIICVGHHSETQEKMVVYIKLNTTPKGYLILEPLYDDEPCIRPLDMFMSEVDHEKYPNVKQKYRFEEFKVTDATPL